MKRYYVVLFRDHCTCFIILKTLHNYFSNDMSSRPDMQLNCYGLLILTNGRGIHRYYCPLIAPFHMLLNRKWTGFTTRFPKLYM